MVSGTITYTMCSCFILFLFCFHFFLSSSFLFFVWSHFVISRALMFPPYKSLTTKEKKKKYPVNISIRYSWNYFHFHSIDIHTILSLARIIVKLMSFKLPVNPFGSCYHYPHKHNRIPPVERSSLILSFPLTLSSIAPAGPSRSHPTYVHPSPRRKPNTNVFMCRSP